MGRWNEKVVVITGAGSGIGRALAQLMDSRGARLALSDIDLGSVEATAATCRDARAYHLDVADRVAVKGHAEQVVTDFGRVDMVVNNAGVALASEVLTQTDEDLDWLLGINLHGVIHGTQAFLPHLVPTRGHVVNISSVFGIMAMPSQSAYNAAKFGVRGYTESLAIEMDMARTGVGVHCVHPGGIATNIANASRHAPGVDADELIERFNRLMLRTPAEVAAKVILRGVERNRRRILIGPDAYAISLGERLLGSAYQRLIAATAGRFMPPTVVTGSTTSPDVLDQAAPVAASR